MVKIFCKILVQVFKLFIMNFGGKYDWECTYLRSQKIDCIIFNTLPIEFDSGLTDRQVDVLYELQTEMTILL